MHRFAVLGSLVLFAANAAAQCLDTSAPGTTIGSGDETLFAPVAMGISFPMAGSPGGPYTHCAVGTNGVLYLTTGGAAVGASGSQIGGAAQLTGVGGDSPRIAPFWTDLVCQAPASFVAIDTSVAGRCAVTWLNANEFLQAPTKSFKAELFSTGVVRFTYSPGMAVDALNVTVGVSVGNGVANPGTSDLSSLPVSATGIMWQLFDPFGVPFDLGGRSIDFTPSGAGYAVSASCTPAFHAAYGSGCYSIASESFYQYFPTAAAAAAALNGQSMRLVPTGSGYTVSWGGGVYVTPTGAVSLPANDDDQTPVTPSLALPVPGGSAATLHVHTNGYVSTAATNDSVLDNATWNPPTNTDYTPSPNFRNAPATAFWSWHDYVSSSGSGRVKRHEANVGGDTVLYVTWDAVESYPPATTNPSTFQFQFNLTTGVVTYVWQSLASVGAAPEAHLIGFSTGGSSLDPGSITLASALPVTTQPDQDPLTLSASPAPVFSIGGSSVPITYTLSNVVDLGGGFGLPLLFFSVAPLPGGLDLGFLGMPGCNLNIASLDVTLYPSTTAPISTITLSIPQPLSAGLSFWSQGLSLFVPNSLPNGQNSFGGVMSNGLQSSFNTR